MRTAQVSIYKFAELSEAAKKVAHNNYLSKYLDTNIFSEYYRETIIMGLDEFGAKAGNYSLDYSSAKQSFVNFTVNENPIGQELREFLAYFDLSKECPLTGTYTDETFLAPLKAFLDKPDDNTSLQGLLNQCLSACFEAIVSEYDYYTSEEAAEEFFNSNEIEFYANGQKL